MALRELLAVFEVSVEGIGKIRDANDKITQLGKGGASSGEMLRAAFQGLGLGAVAAGVGAFVQHFTTAADAVGDLAERMEVSATELQRLQFAADRGGGSAEDVAMAYKGLANALQMAKQGAGEAGPILKKLGIATEDAQGKQLGFSDILGNVGAALGKIEDPLQRAGIAQKLLGESGGKLVPMLLKLKRSSEEFDTLGGGMSEEAVKSAGDFADRIKDLSLAYQGLSSRIYAGIIPAFTWIVEKATAVSTWFTRVTAGTRFVESAAIVLSAVFLKLGIAMVTPFLPALLILAKWTLAILAAAIVVDDFFAFWEGRPSVFGAVIDAIFGEGNSKKLHDFVHDFVDTVKWGWNEMAGGGNLWGEGIRLMLEDVARWFDKIAKYITDNPIWNALSKLGQYSNPTGGVGMGFGGGGFGVPALPAAGGGVSNRTDARTQTVNVTVSGASDPGATGKAVAREASSAFSYGNADTNMLLGAGVAVTP